MTTSSRKVSSRLTTSLASPHAAVVYALIVLAIVSPLLASGSLSQSALLSMLPFAAVLAIIAAGQTLVIQQAGIDLSVPGMVSASAMIVNTVANGQNGLPVVEGIAIAIGTTVLAGVVTGFVISWFSVTPLVATLALNGLLLGLVLFISGGQIAQTSPSSLTNFAIEKTLGIPNTVLVAVVVLALLSVLTTRTTYGRRFVAVGISRRVAHITGVRTTAYTVSAFALAGACYGIAGIVLAAFLRTPSVLVGNDYLLPSIAAVVVGGTALTGGRGSIIASALGALFLTQLDQVISAMGAPASVQLLVQGAVILVALVVPAAITFGRNRVRPTPKVTAPPPATPELIPTGAPTSTVHSTKKEELS